MIKSLVGLLLVGTSAAGWLHVSHSASLPLEAGSITVEWAPGREAVVRISADSEQDLSGLRVLRPDGHQLVELNARATVDNKLASLELELREGSLAELTSKYAPGPYRFVADTTSGDQAVGLAWLSFELPTQPVILQPREGAVLTGHDVSVLWQAQSDAVAYEVHVEQNDDEGLRVKLPPQKHFLRVPPGLLEAATDTHIEIAAIGANGNRTIAEVAFVTAP